MADKKDEIIKTNEKKLGLADVSLEVLAQENAGVKKLMEVNEENIKKFKTISEEFDKLKPAIAELEKIKSEQRETLVKDFKERTGDKFNDAQIKEMSDNHINDILTVIPNSATPETTVKRIAAGVPPAGGNKGMDVEKLQTYMNGVDVRDPKTGKWTRPGEEVFNP